MAKRKSNRDSAAGEGAAIEPSGENRGPALRVLDVEHVAAGHRKTYLPKKNLKAIVEAANAEQGIPLYLGEAFDDAGDALANSDEAVGMLINWTNQWDEWIEAVAEGLSDELIERLENDWSLHAVQLALPLADDGKRLADDPAPIEVYLLPNGHPPELVENFTAGYIEIVTGWNGSLRDGVLPAGEVAGDVLHDAGSAGGDGNAVEPSGANRWASDARFLPCKISDAEAMAKNRKLAAAQQHLDALIGQLKATKEHYTDRLNALDKDLARIAAAIVEESAAEGCAEIETLEEQREALEQRDQVRGEFADAKRRLSLIVNAKSGVVENLEEELRTREEWRRVAVETRTDVGAKELYDIRLDTGNEIPGTRRGLSQADRQGELEIN